METKFPTETWPHSSKPQKARAYELGQNNQRVPTPQDVGAGRPGNTIWDWVLRDPLDPYYTAI